MNKACLTFDAQIENELFARCVAAAFVASCNPTMDELVEIKTIVSEAIANAIIHGYDGQEGSIELLMQLDQNVLTMKIKDYGCGIEDVEEALKPLFTTKAHLERSGMGMTIMESLADEFYIDSQVGVGTTITVVKKMKDQIIHEKNH